MAGCAPRRRLARALCAAACALCVARCAAATGGTAGLSAGLLASAPLDLSESAAHPGHAAARFAAGASRAGVARALHANDDGGAGGTLGASLAEALADAGVPPGGRVHAVHADATELDFLRNWARAARVQRIPNLALLALDGDAAAAGERLGLTTFSVGALVGSGHGAAEARRTGVPALLQALLALGHDVLLSEPDVVWLRDPALYLAVYDMAAADVLVASECRHHFVAREGPHPLTGESREPLDAPFSLSVLLVKPTPPASAFLAAWAHAMAADPAASALRTFEATMLPEPRATRVMTLQPVPGGSWDAARVQDLFPRYPPRVNDGTQAAPYWAFGGSLGLGVLPVGLFANGHAFYTSDLPSLYRLKPYTVHAGAEARGAAAARQRLRAARLWADPPAYYADGKLLALNLVIPAALADAAEARATPARGVSGAHGALLRWQLARVAEAFAVARAAGRALVLPRLLCSCDPEAVSNCTAGEVSLPFNCALDAAVDVAALDAAGWAYREHSLLDNPRLKDAPGGVAPRLVLRPCADALAPPARGAAAATKADAPPCGSGANELPAGGSVATVAAALMRHDDARVVQLDVLGEGLVSGFDSKKEADAFNAAFAEIARIEVPLIPTL